MVHGWCAGGEVSIRRLRRLLNLSRSRVNAAARH